MNNQHLNISLLNQVIMNDRLAIDVVSENKIALVVACLMAHYIQKNPYFLGCLVTEFLVNLNLDIFITFKCKKVFDGETFVLVLKMINEFDLISIGFMYNCLCCTRVLLAWIFMDDTLVGL